MSIFAGEFVRFLAVIAVGERSISIKKVANIATPPLYKMLGQLPPVLLVLGAGQVFRQSSKLRFEQ